MCGLLLVAYVESSVLHLHLHASLITTRRCCCAPPQGCTLRPLERARWPSTRCVPVRQAASALSLLKPDMACHLTPGKPAFHTAFESTCTTAEAGCRGLCGRPAAVMMVLPAAAELLSDDSNFRAGLIPLLAPTAAHLLASGGL